jgi:hypothetical protein
MMRGRPALIRGADRRGSGEAHAARQRVTRPDGAVAVEEEGMPAARRCSDNENLADLPNRLGKAGAKAFDEEIRTDDMNS